MADSYVHILMYIKTFRTVIHTGTYSTVMLTSILNTESCVLKPIQNVALLSGLHGPGLLLDSLQAVWPVIARQSTV
jgi:hypothetical protein